VKPGPLSLVVTLSGCLRFHCEFRRASTVSRLVSSPLRRFIIAEWVYSSLDRGYFLRNEFQECLSEMGLPHVAMLSRTEWTAIRGVMGRPRRLSARFLQEERKKLKRYRDDIRLVQQGKVGGHGVGLLRVSYGSVCQG
jgi:hypothetical protein